LTSYQPVAKAHRTTQHRNTKVNNIHAPSRIRTHGPINQAATGTGRILVGKQDLSVLRHCLQTSSEAHAAYCPLLPITLLPELKQLKHEA
jgi:hypothetical protein